MSSLTAIFGNSEDKAQDSEKLMDLYWNRAELKKEFAALRKEQHWLKDRIKERDGAMARLQQKLEHLENLLLDPQWAHNVVVFFQLRGLALRSEAKLAKFAEQLKQQREKKQQTSILAEWNEKRAAEIANIEQQLHETRETVHRLEQQLQSERHRITSMSGFMRFIRRRSITATLDGLAEQIDGGAQEEQALLQEIEQIQDRAPPDAAGLDIPTKRSINLMVLAFAQQLYLQLAEDDLAELVKEAGEKSVGSINYGSHHDCNELLERVNMLIESMERNNEAAETLQRRSILLSEKALFHGDADAVPVTCPPRATARPRAAFEGERCTIW